MPVECAANIFGLRVDLFIHRDLEDITMHFRHPFAECLGKLDLLFVCEVNFGKDDNATILEHFANPGGVAAGQERLLVGLDNGADQRLHFGHDKLVRKGCGHWIDPPETGFY